MCPSDFSPYVIQKDATIEDAMVAIEANRHRSLIVLNESRRVVGTLSDGDLRKAILARRLLSTPIHQVMNLNFIAINSAERTQALEIFERDHIFLLPVIDDHGQLLDVVAAY